MVGIDRPANRRALPPAIYAHNAFYAALLNSASDIIPRVTRSRSVPRVAGTHGTLIPLEQHLIQPGGSRFKTSWGTWGCRTGQRHTAPCRAADAGAIDRKYNR